VPSVLLASAASMRPAAAAVRSGVITVASAARISARATPSVRA
jgi:hypothetical protein